MHLSRLLVGALSLLLVAQAMLVTADPPAPAVRFTDCAGRLLQGVAQADEAGETIIPAGDFNGDGHEDLFVGAPRSDARGINSGMIYLVHGPIDGALDLADADATVAGYDAADLAGYSLAVGDVSGDGQLDLIVGAPTASPVGPPTGAAYVVNGPITGPTTLSTANAAIYGAVVYGAGSDNVGLSVAHVGDVNGDGLGDLLVSASTRSETLHRQGAAYLFYGPVQGLLTIADADVSFYGEAAADNLGFPVAPAGDMNGDGYADLLLGAIFHDTGAPDAGAVYIVHGGPALPAAMSAAAADARILGDVRGMMAGWNLLAPGDLDGDGHPDLLVGAGGDDTAANRAGSVSFLAGPFSGDRSLASAEAKWLGATIAAEAGSAIGMAGDWDGDGHEDILIGAQDTYRAGISVGAVHVVRGGPGLSGTMSLADAMVTVYGVAHGDLTGRTAFGGIDYDEDGEPDLVIGAPLRDIGVENRGAVVLMDRSTVYDDSDGDMLTDDCEVHRYVTDPLDADTDDDGLSDGAELLVHSTDAHDKDTDGDLHSDFFEVEMGTDPRDPFSLPVRGQEVDVPVKPWTQNPVLDDQDPIF